MGCDTVVPSSVPARSAPASRSAAGGAQELGVEDEDTSTRAPQLQWWRLLGRRDCAQGISSTCFPRILGRKTEEVTISHSLVCRRKTIMGEARSLGETVRAAGWPEFWNLCLRHAYCKRVTGQMNSGTLRVGSLPSSNLRPPSTVARRSIRKKCRRSKFLVFLC